MTVGWTPGQVEILSVETENEEKQGGACGERLPTKRCPEMRCNSRGYSRIVFQYVCVYPALREQASH